MRKRLTSRLLSSTLQPSEERGVALILTLAIIALVTLLLIAFVTSMRVENAASKNFNDLIKTRELALGAIDQAVATIRQATPLRSTSPLSTYATGPGVIWTNAGGLFGPVYLFSAPTSTDTNDMNNGFLITGSNGEFTVAANSQIPAGWVYVPQNPSATAGPNNPIIGRYAFWVDDEASKININTTGKPTTPDAYGTSVPNDVDVSMLLPNLNTAPIATRQTTPGYTTIEEVKIVDPSANPDMDFTANQFSMTTYSTDGNYPNYTDDLDMFDRPRMIISSLKTGDIDGSAGGTSNAFFRLKDRSLNQIYGGSFQDKYTAAGLEQIIANIIAYQINPAATNPPDASPSADPPAYLGLARTPYVNELRVSYAENAGTITRTVQVELFYEYGADGSSYATAPDTIVVKNLPLVAGMPTTVTLANTVTGTFSSGQKFSSSPYSAPVDTKSAVLPLSIPGTVAGTPVTVDYYRGASTYRLDCAQVPLLTTTLSVPGTTVSQGAEVNDPCLNELVAQWTPYVGDGNAGTLGKQNSVYAPKEARPSKTLMRGAPMKSIGELGYIHTADPAGWKYLTLQPGGNGGPASIPDWAMLDFFTVDPTLVPKSTTGRINVNSFINPGFNIVSIRRLVPLKALLNGVITPPDTVAQNIYDDLPPGRVIDKYGMSNGRDGVFDTIGEVCEVTSLGNGATSQADLEAGIRQIANIITVRSSTFTIWVTAQSIKQPPINPTIGTYVPGVDLITGEVKAQAVVERYESTPGSAPKFRTRYFRYLYN